MRIGVDLDGTVYGHPLFFREFIRTFYECGHEIFCTSNHLRRRWPQDSERLARLDIPPYMISPELMSDDAEYVRRNGARNKARMADHLDLVFDDEADRFQKLTKTPVFKVPK